MIGEHMVKILEDWMTDLVLWLLLSAHSIHMYDTANTESTYTITQSSSHMSNSSSKTVFRWPLRFPSTPTTLSQV